MAHSRIARDFVLPWANIYFRHCHGKLRQIKPEQAGQVRRLRTSTL